MNCGFDSIKIGMASPEKILEWSYGEVTKPDTINYRTLKPEQGGLFCERIFGPSKDWECCCGKYKSVQYAGKVCDRCGVEVTRSKVRRERMGHIELAVPVSHIWYFKGVPSRIGLILDVTPRNLEKVIYYTDYIVTNPGDSPLTKCQVITYDEYMIYREKYGDDVEADIGAGAIRKLLEDIDLQKLHDRLIADLKTASGQKRLKMLKRLEVVNDLLRSGNRPEWMILTILPVIPPDLRPMVQLDGGRFATADLNDLYRRVISRNNRLKRLISIQAPDIIVRNEKRMLQESVDALLDNGRRGRAITGKNNRPLKSLSDLLKGKQGRFRQNLLGKRVDYSGRSVIVVGPELKIYQCGVPKEMALELFKPFIMRRLVEDKKAGNIKAAKKMIEKGVTEVWDALDIVIKDHPVMLNRAPTLHRLGIQAFEPVLVEGHALKLHPLNCTAFNADFDGDQMAIHVPLSAEAQAEARILMLSSNNLLRPQDGGPVTVPTQDMVLGSYYLTMERIGKAETGAEQVICLDSGDTGLKSGELVDSDQLLALNAELAKDKSKKQATYISRHIYRSEEEAMMAYNSGAIGIHCPIRVRHTVTIDGIPYSKVVNSTPGRLIFNHNIPQDLGFVDRTDETHICDYEIGFMCGKKELGTIVDRVINKHGFTKAAEVLDTIKSTGYKYSTKAAITVSIWDMSIPKSKYRLVDEAEKSVVNIENMYKMGFMTDHERYKQVIDIWEDTTEKVSDELQANLDHYNPVFMMADSGARGSMKQIRQLAGMRGLIANTAGKTIEIPIKANYREGLTALEYFTSSRGARKGLADTALRTADSGYLTRRMVDVSQEVIITEPDCGTTYGIKVGDITEDSQVIERLEERIRGRFLAADIIDAKTSEVLISTDIMLSDKEANILRSNHWTQKITNEDGEIQIFEYDPADEKSELVVMIRSVITCKSHRGVCAKCYGMNLATQQPVGMGESVGVIAAQSIGEPGTQLTMRTFHTGGLAGGDITQGLPRVEELFEARKPKRMAVLAEIDGTVTLSKGKGSLTEIKIQNGDNIWKCEVPYTGILVKDGNEVKAGQQLTYGASYPNDVLRISGEDAVYTYLIKEVLKVYHQQGVDINDKHIEVIVRQMMRKIVVDDAGDTNLIAGSTVDVSEFDYENNQINKKNRELHMGNTDSEDNQLKRAVGTRLILGITKAALNTDSFLSAASFQETTRVLSDAAIKGKVDHLTGLKENVIIGKLIPAGTGLDVNQCQMDMSNIEVKVKAY